MAIPRLKNRRDQPQLIPVQSSLSRPTPFSTLDARPCSQWYTWMNIIARRHTLKSRSSTDWDVPGIVTGKAANPVIRYMNVWDMSMKRPEAHLKPPKDCLHWCMVGVMNYWQEVSEEKIRSSWRVFARSDLKLMNGTPDFGPLFIAAAMEHDRRGIKEYRLRRSNAPSRVRGAGPSGSASGPHCLAAIVSCTLWVIDTGCS